MREQDGVVVVKDGVDRRRPGRAAAGARRPGHGRAVEVREQGHYDFKDAGYDNDLQSYTYATSQQLQRTLLQLA